MGNMQTMAAGAAELTPSKQSGKYSLEMCFPDCACLVTISIMQILDAVEICA